MGSGLPRLLDMGSKALPSLRITKVTGVNTASPAAVRTAVAAPAVIWMILSPNPIRQ